MGIDLKQFHQAFFEESLELLTGMEEALLELDLNHPDDEKINTIFRAMHSIKGSSTAFDFKVISEFSHTVEAFLSQVRDHKLKLTQNSKELLLTTVDCLRGMIRKLQQELTVNEDDCRELLEHYRAILNNKATAADTISKKEEEKKSFTSLDITDTDLRKESTEIIGYRMKFRPEPNLFLCGNDPLHIFRMLQNFGQLETYLDNESIPHITQLNPKKCYLSWNLVLYTHAKIKQVKTAFDWIIDNCMLDIEIIDNHDERAYTSVLPTVIIDHAQAKIEKSPVSAIYDNNQNRLQETDKSNPLIAETKSPIAYQSNPIEHASIRVATNKIDAIVNIVGELTITQSMLEGIADNNFSLDKLQNLQEGLAQLAHNCRELQESVMRIRMLPIAFVFNRFQRIVHDLSQQLGKKVELHISGEQTELDKNMMEKIADPLNHLVRNALDHGIEIPAMRKAANKPETGQLRLSAHQRESNIVITIEDDGAGLNKAKILAKALATGIIKESDKLTDKQIYDLIFHSGFSTAEKITTVSGRGVGMDVVRKNIYELGGNINIQSTEGKGTLMTINLPLTLAIMDCQLVTIAQQIYIIPLISIIEIIKMEKQYVYSMDEYTEVYGLRDRYLPIIYLNKLFQLNNQPPNDHENKILIIVEVNQQTYGLVVEGLASQQQVVIKSLKENYRKIQGISGATILGDGNIALIIDVTECVLKFIANKNPNLTEDNEITYKNTLEEHDHFDYTYSLLPAAQLQVLSFKAGGKEYGINITAITEVQRCEKITPLPNSPAYIVGVTNIRGNIIPIIHLQTRLNLKQAQSIISPIIIVVKMTAQQRTRSFGIIVDEVNATYHLQRSDIKPTPNFKGSMLKYFIEGIASIEDKTIALLCVESLLNHSENI